jgi:hypothetical protein
VTDDLPTTTADQSCAFCGSASVAWVHRLDRARLLFVSYGREHTLPTFWTVCDACEPLVRSGDDDALAERMARSYGPGDVTEQVRAPLAAFRRADLGATPLRSEP